MFKSTNPGIGDMSLAALSQDFGHVSPQPALDANNQPNPVAVVVINAQRAHEVINSSHAYGSTGPFAHALNTDAKIRHDLEQWQKSRGPKAEADLT